MMITASKLYILAHCPAAAALPEVKEERSEAAAYGTAIHAFLSNAGAAGREAALELAGDEYREACEAIDLEALPVGKAHTHHEVGYAYDVLTGEVQHLGNNLTRDAIDRTKHPDSLYLVGIFDLAGFTPDNRGLVLDVKTGWRRQPPANTSEQLLLGAVCLARHAKLDQVIVGHVILREGQRPFFSMATLDELALGAAEANLVGLHRRAIQQRELRAVGSDDLRYSLGDWCRYCPAKLHCAAQTKLVRAMASQPVTLEAMVKEALTEATAATAITRLEILQDAMNRAWAALYAYAEEHPIQMPDGRWFRKGRKSRWTFDPQITAQVLSELVGPELAMRAFTLKASVKRIEDLARKLVKEEKAPGTIKETREGLLESITAAGGRKKEVTEKVDFFGTEKDGPEEIEG